MLRLAVIFLFWGCLCALAVSAAPVSSIEPLSEFTPASFYLQWSTSDRVSDASFTVYQRKVSDGLPGLWQPIPSLVSIGATESIVNGTHGEHFQFRSEAITAEGKERYSLADFDRNYDMHLMGYVSNGIPLNTRFNLDVDSPAEGTGYFKISFRYDGEKDKQFPDNVFFGFPFNQNLPLQDWSEYRYLEFNYWSNFPDDLFLLIRSASHELKVPVMDFSETGKEQRKWHSIVVDLDRELCSPQDRSSIQTFSFVKEEKTLDREFEYKFCLDGVRLWTSRNIQATTFDATPPSAPDTIRYERKKNRIEWSWDSAAEDLSEIEGYTVSFEKDYRIDPPLQVVTKESSMTLPFISPPYYTHYFFKVRAKNSAGEWSEIVTQKLVCNPNES